MSTQRVPPCRTGRQHSWSIRVSTHGAEAPQRGVFVIDRCAKCGLTRTKRHYRTFHEGAPRTEARYQPTEGEDC